MFWSNFIKKWNEGWTYRTLFLPSSVYTCSFSHSSPSITPHKQLHNLFWKNLNHFILSTSLPSTSLEPFYWLTTDCPCFFNSKLIRISFYWNWKRADIWYYYCGKDLAIIHTAGWVANFFSFFFQLFQA